MNKEELIQKVNDINVKIKNYQSQINQLREEGLKILGKIELLNEQENDNRNIINSNNSGITGTDNGKKGKKDIGKA